MFRLKKGGTPKTFLDAKIIGSRKKVGRPKQRWFDDVKNAIKIGVLKMQNERQSAWKVSLGRPNLYRPIKKKV